MEVSVVITEFFLSKLEVFLFYQTLQMHAEKLQIESSDLLFMHTTTVCSFTEAVPLGRLILTLT